MVFLCSGSNIWDNWMSFCSVLFLESTVIKFFFFFFLLVNKEIKVFSRKSNFEGEKFLLLQDEHIFFVFTFRVDYEMYSFVENEKYLCLKDDEQLVVHSR